MSRKFRAEGFPEDVMENQRVRCYWLYTELTKLILMAYAHRGVVGSYGMRGSVFCF